MSAAAGWAGAGVAGTEASPEHHQSRAEHQGWAGAQVPLVPHGCVGETQLGLTGTP